MNASRWGCPINLALEALGDRWSHRHRAGIKVVHADRIQRVTVLALDVLILDPGQPAEVVEFTKSALFREALQGPVSRAGV